MPKDIEALRHWIFVCVVVASAATTAVPFIYSFFPWRLRPIGKLFMIQSISFALAMDVTALFMMWPTDNILLLFWIDALVLTFIAASSALMAIWLVGRMIQAKKGDRDDSR